VLLWGVVGLVLGGGGGGAPPGKPTGLEFRLLLLVLNEILEVFRILFGKVRKVGV